RYVALARDLGQNVELGGARTVEQPVPQLRPDAGDTAQLRLRDPEADRAAHAVDVGQQSLDLALVAGLDHAHQEDRRLAGGDQDLLRLGGGHPSTFWRTGPPRDSQRAATSGCPP